MPRGNPATTKACQQPAERTALRSSARPRLALLAAALAGAILGTGCEAAFVAHEMSGDDKANGSYSVVASLPSSLAKYGSLGVLVNNSSRTPLVAADADRVAAFLTKGLQDFGEIADVHQVASPDDAVELQLVVTVTYWKPVTSRQRKLFGKTAGDCQVRGVVQLKERAADKVIGQATFMSYSGAVSSFSGTSEHVLDFAANQVLLFMTE